MNTSKKLSNGKQNFGHIKEALNGVLTSSQGAEIAKRSRRVSECFRGGKRISKAMKPVGERGSGTPQKPVLRRIKGLKVAHFQRKKKKTKRSNSKRVSRRSERKGHAVERQVETDFTADIRFYMGLLRILFLWLFGLVQSFLDFLVMVSKYLLSETDKRRDMTLSDDKSAREVSAERKRITLNPKVLEDQSKFESSSSIADLNLEKGSQVKPEELLKSSLKENMSSIATQSKNLENQVQDVKQTDYVNESKDMNLSKGDALTNSLKEKEPQLISVGNLLDDNVLSEKQSEVEQNSDSILSPPNLAGKEHIEIVESSEMPMPQSNKEKTDLLVTADEPKSEPSKRLLSAKLAREKQSQRQAKLLVHRQKFSAAHEKKTAALKAKKQLALEKWNKILSV